MEILHAIRARARCAALVAAGIFGAAGPVLAHHSFTMFDMTKRVMLTGTVTSFEWTNPHSYIDRRSRRQRRGQALEYRTGQPQHPDAERLEVQ
jgi:Family of unknown function (DUF6152)